MSNTDPQARPRCCPWKVLMTYDSWPPLHQRRVRIFDFSDTLTIPAHWQELTELRLAFAPFKLKHIRVLCQSRLLEQLRVLRIDNIPIGVRGAQMLSNARFAPNLEVLSLNRCRLRSDGVEALVSGKPWQRLKQLDLTGEHFMGRRGADALMRSEALPALETLDFEPHGVGPHGTWALRARWPEPEDGDVAGYARLGLNERLTLLRQEVHREPSSFAWSNLCALASCWPEASIQGVAMDYLMEHLQSWPVQTRRLPPQWLHESPATPFARWRLWPHTELARSADLNACLAQVSGSQHCSFSKTKTHPAEAMEHVFKSGTLASIVSIKCVNQGWLVRLLMENLGHLPELNTLHLVYAAVGESLSSGSPHPKIGHLILERCRPEPPRWRWQQVRFSALETLEVRQIHDLTTWIDPQQRVWPRSEVLRSLTLQAVSYHRQLAAHELWRFLEHLSGAHPRLEALTLQGWQFLQDCDGILERWCADNAVQLTLDPSKTG